MEIKERYQFRGARDSHVDRKTKEQFVDVLTKFYTRQGFLYDRIGTT